MQQQGDEKDNLTRIGFAILDEVQDAVRTVVDVNIPISLEDIFDKYKHKIYHFFSNKCCFKCDKYSPLYRNKHILTRPQMEIVYEKSKKHTHENYYYCCATAIPGIQSEKFDLSFLNAFLTIFPELIYWPSCLSNQSKSLEDLLNDHKHNLYHLYDKTSCCYCLPGTQPSTDDFKITKQQFESLFDRQGSVSCINIGSPGQCICLFSSKFLIKESLDDWLTNMILRICCPLKQSIEALVEVRNKVRGHARNSKMSNEDFKNNWCIIEEKVPELLNHGIVDNMKKETANHEFTQRLKDLKVKPLTEESYRQVITALLQQNEIKQDMKELSENVQNLQSVAENTQAGVLNLQSLPGQVDGIEKKLTELLMRDRNTNSDIDTDAVPFLPEDEPGSQDRNTNSDIDTDAVLFLPEDEPGSQDRTTNSDLNSDSEPYLTETEPRSQGAEAVERRDERSVDRKEQTYIKTGVTGSEQTFRKDGYKYDTLVLHSEDDEEHVNEMIKMMEEKVDLPDVKIVSVGDDMVAGTSLFKSFFKLLDDSCTVLLFVTPSFYTDCWSDHRLETVLADRMKGSPCVIPVLYGEKKLRDELKVLGNIKTIIFFKEEDGDKYKSFITKITKALEHYRGKVNK